jgi:hypothetical protein
MPTIAREPQGRATKKTTTATKESWTAIIWTLGSIRRTCRAAMARCGGQAVTDLSNVKARLHRLPLRTIIALTWRLKLARLFLWLARVTDTYDGVVMRIVRRIVESAERCAVKSDDLRRRLRP